MTADQLTLSQTPTSATNLTPAFSFGVPTNASPIPFAAALPGFTQPAPFAFTGKNCTWIYLADVYRWATLL